MIPGAESHVARHRRELRGFFALQRSVVIPVGSLALAAFDLERWNEELAVIMLALAVPTVQAFGDEIADRYGITIAASDLAPFLRPYARISAQNTNRTTLDNLAKATASDDPIGQAGHVFDVAEQSRSGQIATSKVTTEANLGRDFAAKEAGVKRKRWVVTSGNPRPQHAAMRGQTVAITRRFSNGAEWPGDPTLSIDQRAGCSCLVEFER